MNHDDFCYILGSSSAAVANVTLMRRAEVTRTHYYGTPPMYIYVYIIPLPTLYATLSLSY